MVKIKIQFNSWPNSKSLVEASLLTLNVECLVGKNDGYMEPTNWPLNDVVLWCHNHGLFKAVFREVVRGTYQVVFMDRAYERFEAQQEDYVLTHDVG